MGFATAESVVYAGLELVPVSFAAVSGKEVMQVEDVPVEIFPIEERQSVMQDMLGQYPDLMVIDFTLPDAVNSNAEFYIENKVPFVMGTTGGDREKLLKDVNDAGLYAVIAANMGKQIVALQAMLQYAAREFPGAFSGYKLDVVESHQSTKVDTSGTAKDIVTSFNDLGMPCEEEDIRKVREVKQQMEEMKVPEEHLNGHAFHTYTLTSEDESVNFQFQHNVCGRRFYAEGSVDAALFLANQIAGKSDKKLFDMIDVLNAGVMR
jgi:4-hydroxy-tetrahydrodipicolinate reductase